VLGSRLRIGHGYGMTETHGSVTMNAGRSLAARPGSVGLPGPLVDVKILDESGADAPVDSPGEILIRGVTVTPGYWGDPDATATIIRDGWLHTGDVGRLDQDGYVYLVDRLKDLVIRGGENIATVEIEHCLEEHPAVEEVAVFGVPDDDLGERIGAMVVLKAGAAATQLDLADFVRGKLAPFKVPERMWITFEPLQRNALGKVMKSELRALSVQVAHDAHG
jgi:long-chain acyl-CoA synthetase